MNTQKSSALLVAIMLLLIAFSNSAALAGPEFKTLDTAQLKAMLDAKEQFLLIDARTAAEYDEAHIVSAISMPEKTFEAALSSLPADKGSLLVFYCNGVKCGKSKKAAVKAAAAGFSNIMLYTEGFPVWEEKAMPIVAGAEYGKKIETIKLKAQEMKELIDSAANDYVLVDVRDENEFQEGHIPTAINIPVETFALKSESLPKEKKVIVYCNTGGRSYTAYRKLGKLAYPHIFQTTLAAWKEAGFPLEK